MHVLCNTLKLGAQNLMEIIFCYTCYFMVQREVEMGYTHIACGIVPTRRRITQLLQLRASCSLKVCWACAEVLVVSIYTRATIFTGTGSAHVHIYFTIFPLQDKCSILY